MTAVEHSARAVPIIRRIFSEFRRADKTFSHESAAARFLMRELQEHQLTQRMLCKAPNEAEHLASTYEHYLASTRRLKELQQQYQGGERSIEQSATLVGLKLPERTN